MKLLAISGGPDSMFLLNQYKKKKVVVATVNYNKREDSNVDVEIVKEFCEANNIPFELLSINEKPKGNFQSWARDVRYDFFKKIYDKYNCNELLMGHHMDDFLETALMQQKSGRTPRYFGIKKTNEINGMEIYRPLIDSYWKSEILEYLEKYNIKYAIDSSNEQPIFERNKERLLLKEKTIQEKTSMYKWFKMSNKILVKKFNKVDYLYSRWEKSKFDSRLFKAIKYKEEVIFEYINKNFSDVKLSSGKIKSLVDYIISPNGGKTFKVSDNQSITKVNGFLEKSKHETKGS